MCGRYVGTPTPPLTWRTPSTLIDVEDAGNGPPGPVWNIKPTNRVPVVFEAANDGDQTMRRLEPARWSLTPSYAKELTAPKISQPRGS